MNILLAVAALAGLGIWQRFDGRATDSLPTHLQNLTYLLWVFGVTNIHLTIFNLFPIPPLDGSRILATFSESYAAMTRLLPATAGTMTMAVMFFSAAGNITSPAAVNAATLVLTKVRGF
jgi:Zn-dependent protease